MYFSTITLLSLLSLTVSFMQNLHQPNRNIYPSLILRRLNQPRSILYTSKISEIQNSASNIDQSLNILSQVKGMNNEEKYKLFESLKLKIMENDKPLGSPFNLTYFSNSQIINSRESDADKDHMQKKTSMLESLQALYLATFDNGVVPMTLTQSLLDASAALCNCSQLGYSLRLAQYVGSLKGYGSCVDQLKQLPNSRNQKTQTTNGRRPISTREKDVLSLYLAVGVGVVYSAIQGLAFFDDKKKPWARAATVSAGLAITYDIFAQNYSMIKSVASGFDHLTYFDSKRQAQCQAAGILVGYLIGVPSFCFHSDISEAVRVLRSEVVGMQSLDSKASNFSASVSGLSLGRVMVWIMAPIAAEHLKYGKIIHSNPIMAERLLETIPYEDLGVEVPMTSRQALLEWAYDEAVCLVTRYRVLIENMSDYLQTDSSTVGECVAMIERHLR